MTATAVLLLASQLAVSPPSDDASPWLTPRPKRGTPLRVIDRTGTAITGKLVEVLPATIRLASRDGLREVARADVAVVRRNGDTLWDGLAWGGGVAGLVVSRYNGDCDDCYSTARLTSYRLVVVGIGAGFGALLDWLVRDGRVLYRAPPSATRGSVSNYLSKHRTDH